MHAIQLGILHKLLFSPSLPYSKLKPSSQMENNQFDFHLDQVMKAGYIAKQGRVYILTDQGKEYANMIDRDAQSVTKQAKISMAVCPRRIVDGKKQFLIYTRLKHPFYKCQGFLSGKVGYGEAVIDAVKRELKEETNLEGEPVITSIRHYRVYNQDAMLLEDKFMFFCVVDNPRGDLIESEEGMYEWIDEENLFSYVTNHFVSMEQFREDMEEFSFDSPYTIQRFIEIIQKTEKF